jgi:glycosyltransferase involved in cell wall biosynthesis
MFSVIIPLYNKKDYIKQAVESVLNQSFSKFELIIVDDSSTDGSIETVQSFKDERIKIISRNERGYGGYAARNIGIQEAIYKYVSFLDADDKWNPDYLKTIYELTLKYKDASVYSCAWTEKRGLKEKKNAYYNRNHLKSDHLIENYFKHSYSGENPLCTIVVTVKKDAIINVKSFPEGKCKRGGDIETWMRLARKYKIAWSPYIGAVYNKEVSNAVTKSVPDTEIPYVYLSVEKIANETDNLTELFDLKKYANFYAKMSILHSIVYGKNKKEVMKGFFKEVDRGTYLFLLILKLFPKCIVKPLYKIYRFLMIKYSKSDLG